MTRESILATWETALRAGVPELRAIYRIYPFVTNRTPVPFAVIALERSSQVPLANTVKKVTQEMATLLVNFVPKTDRHMDSFNELIHKVEQLARDTTGAAANVSSVSQVVSWGERISTDTMAVQFTNDQQVSMNAHITVYIDELYDP